MKIGILETGHAPDELKVEHGDYADMFARLLDGHGFAFSRYDVEGGTLPASPDEADGWLITGSRHGAYEDHPWIAPLEEFIRAVRAAGRPMVGICFGHQIIAQALGGKVEKFAGGWSVGRQEYQINGEVIPLNAWHQDQVVELPEGARVVGASDFCANAALVYDDGIFTIQPHPEFDAAVLEGLIRYRGAKVPVSQVEHASSQLDQPLAAGRFAEMMAQFLKEGRLS